MKMNVLSFAFIALAQGLWAQELPVTEKKVKQYSQKIDSIVSAEKKQMIREIDSLEQVISNKEAFFSEKRKIAEKYEKRINEKVSAQQHLLESLTKEQVKNSVMEAQNGEPEPNVISYGSGGIHIKTKKKPYSPNTSGITLSYGFLNLTQEAGSSNPFESESQMRIGNSHSFELQFRKQRQLGDKESPFLMQYGFAWRSDTYMPQKPLVFNSENQQIFMSDFTAGNLKRSKFRNNYITLPVEFLWVINPKYSDVNGSNQLDLRKKGQWKLGLGAYAGIKVRSINKVKYYNGNDKFDKYKDVIDSGVNTFLFGTKLSLSYNSFTLFIKKDITPIFNNQANIPSRHSIQVGIELINLGF